MPLELMVLHQSHVVRLVVTRFWSVQRFIKLRFKVGPLAFNFSVELCQMADLDLMKDQSLERPLRVLTKLRATPEAWQLG
jgi:hypothetical protein